MPNSRLNDLFDLLNSNNISAEQHTELLSLMADPANEQQVTELLKEKWELFKPNKAPFTAKESEVLLNRINAIARVELPRPQFRIWPRIAAAASILVMICIGGYFLYQKTPATKLATDLQHTTPKQQGIELTLANGKKIAIDPSKQSNTYSSDGIQIGQQKGELVYGPQSKADTGMLMHTLANNSGNKYKLILSDGTEVYLDAQSSVTYPVQFTGKQRKVSITGQAYFKVKHDAQKPFIVNAKDQTVEDIGTEFNIRAYDNVATTTLLEGSVRVHANGIKKGLLLIPGEQATVVGGNLSAKLADAEEVTAWLDGKLIFNHESLESILAEVVRVYDVKFTWESNDLKAIKFTGAVSRTRPINTIINYFRATEQVDFKSEGASIKVTKHK
ncbi:FecR family protein [Mucilaginibacter conchicola]|uniref:FecR family protein n=1 Tax=Mucilaginibacter conchicola TaxID=2303333 RepID=A0A372NTM0_9SPHI|nr:FecR family protein [Mucilaginibacter conchicola]RFZ92334.1 FecR family protein [Mucilaginibacter conchicola]